MSRSFMYGTRLQEMEQMMMSVPNFLPRGKGMIIMGKNMIDEKEEFKKCDYCSEFAKGACTASHCLYMTERIGYGQIHYHHIVADRFSDFSNRFFKKRLRQIVRSFRGEWFLSSYHNDRYSYLKESSSLTLKRKSEQLAIIYILSAHEELWDRAKDHIHHKAIELDKISLKGISTNGYALYQAARTIMTGKSYIQITELADDSLISAYAFKAIINAFMIAKYGDEIMTVRQ